MIKKASRKSRARNRLTEHRTWLMKAQALARQSVSRGGSPHPSVKVGVILVSAKGKLLAASSNRFPRGVDRRRKERYAENNRSLWINCAEQLAIAAAARKGVSLKGARMYMTLEPCSPCAGVMAEAGIKEAFIPLGALRNYAKLKDKWKPSIEVGQIKMAEAGIRFTAIDMNGK
jgi:deoxycytidylate deaminase